MKHILYVAALMLACYYSTAAQQTIFVPTCSGTNDTSAFQSIISGAAGNPRTIQIPYKSNTAQRCALNSLTIPSNITLDNTDGSGIKVNSGQTLTLNGSYINPPGKTLFFGPGTAVVNGAGFSTTDSTVQTSRAINTISPIKINGANSADLSANPTLSCPTCVKQNDLATSLRTPNTNVLLGGLHDLGGEVQVEEVTIGAGLNLNAFTNTLSATGGECANATDLTKDPYNVPYNPDPNHGPAGLADASAGIQAAVTAAVAKMCLPTGSYAFTQAAITAAPSLGVVNFFWGADKQELFGQGKGRTVFYTPTTVAWNAGNIALFSLNSHADLKLHGFTFVGSPTVTSGGGAVIQAHFNARRAQIYDFEIRGFSDDPTSPPSVAGFGGVGLAQTFSEADSVTTLGTTIAAGSRTVTPGSMAGISAGRFLPVGGANPETVLVTGRTATTFTALFANSHLSSDSVTVQSEGQQNAKVYDFWIHDNPRMSAIVNAGDGNEIFNGLITENGAPGTGQHAIYDQGGYSNIHHLHIRGQGALCYKAEKNVSGGDFSGGSFHNNVCIDPYSAFVYITAGFENPAIPDDNVIDSIYVTNRGSGYTSAPTVGLTGGPGSGAVLQAIIDKGEVLEVIVVKGGSGYDANSTYTVTFTGGGGSGAAASVQTNAIGYPTNRFMEISHNVFKRTSRRGVPPLTNTEIIAPISLGQGARVLYDDNTAEDIAANTNGRYWLQSGGGGNVVSNSRFIQTNSDFFANGITLGERDKAKNNYIYGRYFANGITVATNTETTGNDIWLLGDDGDSGRCFDFAPASSNVLLADNKCHFTTTAGAIRTNWFFGAPRSIDLRDNLFVAVNNGQLFDSDSLTGMTGVAHHNKCIGCFWNEQTASSSMTLSENELPFSAMGDSGNAGSVVTYTAGQLGVYTYAAGVSVLANRLVKLNSSGKLEGAGTGDTIFAGITTSRLDFAGEGGAYIVDKPGAEYSVDADGAWTSGHVGIISTTDAGKIHDTGSQTPPTYPASYVIFLNSGGASGVARVKIVKAL